MFWKMFVPINSEFDEVWMANAWLYILLLVTDIRLLQWLNDVNFVFGFLHDVDVGSVADISGVYAAFIFSIFRVKMCKLVSFYVCILLFRKFGGGGGELPTTINTS
jgi:hypothetical protein